MTTEVNRRWSSAERHIWNLVCGLPEHRAREKRLLMLRVYIDDSGKSDHSPVQVLAGYLASAERWAIFSNEWQSILDRHGVEHFHMVEAWNRNRKYREKGSVGPDALIVQLLNCIRKHVEHAFVSSLPFDSYNHWFAVSELTNVKSVRPYFWNFYAIMSQVCSYANKSGFSNRVEVVFDEQSGEPQEFILESMSHFRAIAGPILTNVVIPTPTFQNDKDVVPLQAADVLAWLVRRDAFNASKNKIRDKMPEALLLGAALSMPSTVTLWNDKTLEPAAANAARLLLSSR